MSRSLALFAIGLVFGGGIGFVTAAGNGVTFDGHDHSDPSHHAGAGGHDHSTVINLPAGPNAPGVKIQLTQDPMAGWNLHVMPRNFRFAPENASTDDRPGEGHAHVYVNGTKLARLYGNWMHIADLPKGEVEVAVSLNANGHSPFAVDNVPVSASLTVQVE
ncbi:hypothetical protein FGK63_00770 [Ruegeria sediminis]|uniref:DUF4399 domain-containing protein n=1 Tax=Ruegeria sediminis TaxID=2583820 RepID=A0ABY2X2M5_9RHOB|nr:hypothetical protein [Ruegeria sediminis]TMV09634.1 hypothetical protein FGK63_00770 [Ruegeria sediminis]